ncbi:MAG: macro domain-containing protein [Armatimonadota bacterium]|nr:MAG: macro domain-containing protein [Armatimonadota bacterium]
MQRRIEAVTLHLVEGDICDREVDAIVNAANNHLWMGGGVAGAIKRRGGEEVEREATAQGPIAIGESVVTTAGKLKAAHVIHAAVMGPDLVTNADYIRRATLSVLARANDLRLLSIAFPALGTGVGGFSLHECAHIMLDAVTQHAKSQTSLESVEFVLFGRAAYDAFADVIGQE